MLKEKKIKAYPIDWGKNLKKFDVIRATVDPGLTRMDIILRGLQTLTKS